MFHLMPEMLQGKTEIWCGCREHWNNTGTAFINPSMAYVIVWIVIVIYCHVLQFSFSDYITRAYFWQEVVVNKVFFRFFFLRKSFLRLWAKTPRSWIWTGRTQTLNFFIFFFLLLLPFGGDLTLPLSLILFSHKIDGTNLFTPRWECAFYYLWKSSLKSYSCADLYNTDCL